MAQAVKAVPSVSNQELASPNFTDIPGLSIIVLNGSGWIELSYTVALINGYAGIVYAIFQITIDGALLAETYRNTYLGQGAEAEISFSTIIKPGAGAHTYHLQGRSNHTAVKILELYANLIMREPGY
jgi:hypothetical protein